MKRCPYCQAELDFPIGRSTTCPGCSKELHSCYACRFYSLGAAHDCLEDVDEKPRDPDRGNFCELFCLADKSVSGRADKRSEAALKAAKLFGDLL